MELDLDEIDEDEQLILDYIQKEKQFDIFYKNKVSTIECIFIYIVNDKIIKQKKNTIEIENNILSKNKLKTIFLDNKVFDNKCFNLTKLIQFNFFLNHEKLNIFNDKTKNIGNEFLKQYNEITDIYWNDTIDYFKKLNSLYFVFNYVRKSKTRKIWLNIKKKHNKTKKKKFSKETIKMNKKDDIIEIKQPTHHVENKLKLI